MLICNCLDERFRLVAINVCGGRSGSNQASWWGGYPPTNSSSKIMQETLCLAEAVSVFSTPWLTSLLNRRLLFSFLLLFLMKLLAESIIAVLTVHCHHLCPRDTRGVSVGIVRITTLHAAAAVYSNLPLSRNDDNF